MKFDWLTYKDGKPVPPADAIKRLRRNMILHSIFYYKWDDPILTDDEWQLMADDLTELQAMFPEPIGYYDELFKDWSGDTGMHVALQDDYWRAEALYVHRLLRGTKLAS